MSEHEYVCSMPDDWRLMIWKRKEKYGLDEYQFHCGEPEIPCIIQEQKHEVNGVSIILLTFSIFFIFIIIWDLYEKRIKS